MKKINFNQDWAFTFEQNLDAFNLFGIAKYSEATGGAARSYPNHNWERVTLPHDWAVALHKDLEAETSTGARSVSHYHRQNTEYCTNAKEVYHIGWYRKEFLFEKSWAGKRIFLEFEGIFRDAILWVNGVYMDRHASGYTGWMLEITDHLVEGQNSIAVRVDRDQPEGWFYEGAGIYRNVFLHVAEPVYMKPYHTVVCAETDGEVFAETVLVNDTETEITQTVTWEICDKAGNVCAKSETACTIPAYEEAKTWATLSVQNPKLWDLDTPNLYTLHVKAQDETEEAFGFRSFVFDADKGFFLNGKPVKLHGACVHQDFGGVGAALSDNLHYYKIQKLKEMGVNAYRASHNAPAPALLRACDELGMLVMDETRMFGTAPEAMRQLERLILRDRNHPSVFIWCIGNEEFSVQNEAWSKHLAEKAVRFVKKLDKTRLVTYGGNNGANDSGANAAVDVRGINYMANGHGGWIEEYHAAHPAQPMIGTEESSYVLSRGGTENSLGDGKLDYTGTVTMPWGATLRRWVTFYEERPYICGGFMWTGFDYRGEPTPFIRQNVSSSFGTIDLCGMEKPPFYYYQAWWKKEPVLKLAPHWNYQEGDMARITAYTNCESVTLFINGKKVSTKTVEKFGVAVWDVPFEAGVLAAEGVKDGKPYRDEIRTAGEVAGVRAHVVLKGEGAEDVSIVQLDAVDENGILCPNVSDQVEIRIENGTIAGVGNGDPADLDYEQKPTSKRTKYIYTFSGEQGMYVVPDKAPNTQSRRLDWLEMDPTSKDAEDVRLVARYNNEVRKPETYTYTTQVHCNEPYQYVEFERFSGEADVYVNGAKVGEVKKIYRADQITNRPYRFYCDIPAGENELKVVITTQKDWLHAFSGYVKLEKEVEEPWHVRLHYGKARVFVKSAAPEKLNVKIV